MEQRSRKVDQVSTWEPKATLQEEEKLFKVL